ncbi:MAG: arylsulfatase [Spirosomataceae bacterium]
MIKKFLFFTVIFSISISRGFSQIQRPNVILILADDLGYGDLGCFGQKQIATPNIDKLAKEGMIFTRHYAGAPVCAPSRCALMTGKHVGHTSVRGNQPKGQLIKENETTLPEVFKKAGYTTACIGKWGMGNAPEPNDPLLHGFDYHYGYVNMWHAHNFYPEFLYQNAKKIKLEGNVTGIIPPGDFPEGVGLAKERAKYAPDEFDREVGQFIDDHQKSPFFIYYAINTPHGNSEFKVGGMEVPDHKRFDYKDWPEPEKGFAEMITKLDESVGKIVTRLKALGLDENTLILFTSDNGPHNESGHSAYYFDSNGPFRGFKRDMYEGGIRMPFIARYPQKIKAGMISSHISAFWDFLPTVCDLIKVPQPTGIDGISFLPTLLGQKKQATHNYLYWEFYEEGGKQAVLQDNWKGIKLNTNDTTKTTFELYDLSNDPAELQNIAHQYPDKVREMTTTMQKAHTPFALTSLFKPDSTAQRDVQIKK